MEKINGKKYRVFPGQTDPLAEFDFWSRTLMPDGTSYDEYDTTSEVVDEIVNNGKYDIPALPDVGTLIFEGDLYTHDGQVYRVRQDHYVTIYDPDDVPALFTVYRSDTTGTLPWIAGEVVDRGTRRTYADKTWECLQAHTTELGWEPETTAALWKEVTVVGYPVWVQPTGAQDAYALGDIVWFPTEGSTLYRSLINANVWSPVTYPAGWEIYTP